ncbi:class I SAM-dependent methyltransferase [Candidatus Latescibacterota bacterium]
MKSNPHSNQLCPLCSSDRTQEYHRDKHRIFNRCHNCELIFVPPEYFISHEEEKARYDSHINNSDDQGYREFLKRLYKPLEKRLNPKSSGLDFGSGPGPVLSQMFENSGHTMTLYDPFYADNLSALSESYDFITATEVLEHLHHPGMETNRLWECLEPGGWLGIMTCPVPESGAFEDWYYIRDSTHVCFYSHETFRWLAACWNAELTIVEPDVILFKKV